MLFARPDETPTPVEEGLVTPTSMARDDATGAVYISEIFTGRVVRVDGP